MNSYLGIDCTYIFLKQKLGAQSKLHPFDVYIVTPLPHLCQSEKSDLKSEKSGYQLKV